MFRPSLPTSVVVQQVNFVDDDETDELRVRLLSAFSRDDVPFFGSANDDLRGLEGEYNKSENKMPKMNIEIK